MRNAANALLIFWALNLSTDSSLAASIKIVANKYDDYGRFLEQYAQSHKLTLSKALHEKILSKAGDYNLIARLNVIDLPNDEHRRCEQLEYALDGKNAIEIRGAIEPSDGEAFRKVLSESKALEDGKDAEGCGLTVIIDSPGGDLRAALDIGRQVGAKPRLVIVPDGGQCLSACIFILLAETA
jgi:hypothetical protein